MGTPQTEIELEQEGDTSDPGGCQNRLPESQYKSMFLIGKVKSDKYVKDFIFALEEKWKMTKKKGCVN